MRHGLTCLPWPHVTDAFISEESKKYWTFPFFEKRKGDSKGTRRKSFRISADSLKSAHYKPDWGDGGHLSEIHLKSGSSRLSGTHPEETDPFWTLKCQNRGSCHASGHPIRGIRGSAVTRSNELHVQVELLHHLQPWSRAASKQRWFIQNLKLNWLSFVKQLISF